MALVAWGGLLKLFFHSTMDCLHNEKFQITKWNYCSMFSYDSLHRKSTQNWNTFSLDDDQGKCFLKPVIITSQVSLQKQALDWKKKKKISVVNILFSMLAEALSQSSQKKKKIQSAAPFLTINWGGRILRNCLRAPLTLPEIRCHPLQKTPPKTKGFGS